MPVNRRGFLLGTAAAVAGMQALATAQAADTPSGQPQPTLKLSSMLGIVPGKDLDEQLGRLEKWGFEAVELGGDIVENSEKYLKALAKTKLKVSAICFGSLKGGMVSPDEKVRKESAQQLKRVLEAAAQFQSVGVIHVPAFSNETQRTNQEIRQIVVDSYPEIGDYAIKVGSHLILEPLNRNEAFFLRQLADAAAICRDCKSPGIRMMGDFYHMGFEEPNDLGAFISARDYLQHVHIASRKRLLPGQDERSYVEGFRGLKLIGYRGYVSYECAYHGDTDADMPPSVAYLRDQWSLARV